MGGLAGHLVLGLVPAGGQLYAHQHAERGGKQAEHGQYSHHHYQHRATFTTRATKSRSTNNHSFNLFFVLFVMKNHHSTILLIPALIRGTDNLICSVARITIISVA